MGVNKSVVVFNVAAGTSIVILAQRCVVKEGCQMCENRQMLESRLFMNNKKCFPEAGEEEIEDN